MLPPACDFESFLKSVRNHHCNIVPRRSRYTGAIIHQHWSPYHFSLHSVYWDCASEQGVLNTPRVFTQADIDDRPGLSDTAGACRIMREGMLQWLQPRICAMAVSRYAFPRFRAALGLPSIQSILHSCYPRYSVWASPCGPIWLSQFRRLSSCFAKIHSTISKHAFHRLLPYNNDSKKKAVS